MNRSPNAGSAAFPAFPSTITSAAKPAGKPLSALNALVTISSRLALSKLTECESARTAFRQILIPDYSPEFPQIIGEARACNQQGNEQRPTTGGKAKTMDIEEQRTCSGQAIALDSVILEILRERESA